MPKDVSQVVHNVIGPAADDTIIQYIIGILEDEHFEFGDDGEGAFDVMGDLLVNYGACADEDAATEICKSLAKQLAPANKQSSAIPGVRALTNSVALSDNDRSPLLYQVR